MIRKLLFLLVVFSGSVLSASPNGELLFPFAGHYVKIFDTRAESGAYVTTDGLRVYANGREGSQFMYYLNVAVCSGGNPDIVSTGGELPPGFGEWMSRNGPLIPVSMRAYLTASGWAFDSNGNYALIPPELAGVKALRDGFAPGSASLVTVSGALKMGLWIAACVYAVSLAWSVFKRPVASGTESSWQRVGGGVGGASGKEAYTVKGRDGRQGR